MEAVDSFDTFSNLSCIQKNASYKLGVGNKVFNLTEQILKKSKLWNSDEKRLAFFGEEHERLDIYCDKDPSMFKNILMFLKSNGSTKVLYEIFMRERKSFEYIDRFINDLEHYKFKTSVDQQLINNFSYLLSEEGIYEDFEIFKRILSKKLHPSLWKKLTLRFRSKRHCAQKMTLLSNSYDHIRKSIINAKRINDQQLKDERNNELEFEKIYKNISEQTGDDLNKYLLNLEYKYFPVVSNFHKKMIHIFEKEFNNNKYRM